MQHHRVDVRAVRRITPHMARITVGGASPDVLSTSGLPDEYAAFFFPRDGEDEPVLPAPDGMDNRADAPEPSPARYYSIRRWYPDRGELDVDVVLHEGGVAASWARRAKTGDRVALGDPRGGNYEPPADADWRLLVGDATALPAIGRILEEAPAGQRIHVSAVVDDAAEEQELSTAADAEISWFHEPRPDRVGALLQRLVREFPRPPGTGFIWMAGENVAAREIRKHLRHELGLPASAHAEMGYWRPRGEEWMARYAAVGPAVQKKIDNIYEQLSDEEEIVDAVFGIYEEAGL